MLRALVTLMLPQVAAGGRVSPAQVHMVKRGPRAWENYASRPLDSLWAGGTTRLLVHALADASNLQWMPKVRRFLEWVQKEQLPFRTPRDIDLCLATWLDHLCYGLQQSPSQGGLVLFGLLTMAPDLRGSMPLSARSLKSWSKLCVANEGGPVPEEIIWCVAGQLLRNHQVRSALWLLLQYDIYGREQDIEQLQPADLAFDGQVLALTLGTGA